MYKIYCVLILALIHFSAQAEKCGFSSSNSYNFTIPHTNKGILTKTDYQSTIKLLKLSAQEAMSFEKEYIHKNTGMRYNKLSVKGESELKYRTPKIIPIAAYKQYIAESKITLYRLVFEYRFAANLVSNSPYRQIYQKVYYYSPKTKKAQLLFADFYHTTLGETSKPKLEYCKNVMPIAQNGKLTGIVVYGIEKYTEEIINDFDIKQINRQKHYANIYWIENEADINLKIYDTSNNTERSSDLCIDASWPLFNSKDLFNYTIQNAIDNNPKTCFQENTPDNLIDINLDFKKETDLTKIALINGQTETKESYFNNNQITEFAIGYSSAHWNPEFEITPTIQIHEFEKSVIKLCTGALKIKKGRKYNDTCISEFNISTKEKGWLFYHIK